MHSALFKHWPGNNHTCLPGVAQVLAASCRLHRVSSIPHLLAGGTPDTMQANPVLKKLQTLMHLARSRTWVPTVGSMG